MRSPPRSRRRVLVDGEQAAGDLGPMIPREFAITQPALSQHLRVLSLTGGARELELRLTELEPGGTELELQHADVHKQGTWGFLTGPALQQACFN